MGGFARFLFGLVLLPACWGVALAFADAVCIVSDAVNLLNAESLSLLGGIVVFALAWAFLPHPVRTYVLGHELTHALWGLIFGARPSRVRVGASGGSVSLTKTNVVITLAPYFFPFYTFVVILAALITACFVRPLPALPVWLFLIGLTWAFHILFTIETLTARQPDVALYGRVFSWTVIFLANLALILIALAAVTDLTFAELGSLLVHRVSSVYLAIGSFCRANL